MVYRHGGSSPSNADRADPYWDPMLLRRCHDAADGRDGAILLPLHMFPDPVLQSLFADPSVRVLMLGERFGALVLAALGLTAGAMIFCRNRNAGLVVGATIAFTAIFVLADMVIQGWLIVPALRRLAPKLTWPESLIYDPRLRPAWPIAVAAVLLVLLSTIVAMLRRERVRDALQASPATT
jgi:hypothetical protein